ncbi:hypothetical protein EHQ12_01135 [Leptospira gomenensis]|uniref:DUF1574 domain-containing protein n=1 Tax=Leptospira gomenensis TaxID=2484974 RepID=A0A5F1Y705_9LEPT|nr:hypothetical protein EHQ17_17060 [Leptospira gomenensis]TGK45055.1 hypothetical protein EHQ12_01135 [Leptospira gomenensis]TGK51903.1 hypothetical protein EHQ07_01470 [Leptospira gomenensis]TGK67387.1 hypothetical protein EHQ13_02595 [Leptospira gomenensis]
MGILGIVAAFFIFAILQWLSFPFLILFQEKNSFLYDRLSLLGESLFFESTSEKAPVVFLGDSQILSGIRPADLETLIRRPIWFLPRPSEQPEGMLLRWKEYERKYGIKPALVVVNGSVFSLADMDVASAHRSLVLNYDSFFPEIVFDSDFRNFYLKNFSSGTFYLLGRIFPFLRLNAAVSTTIKIVGEGDEFSHSETDLGKLLSGNPLSVWKSRFEKNQFIESEYSKNKGYMDWARSVPFDGICVPNEKPIPLPENSALALRKIRPSAPIAWKKLFSYLREKEIPVLAITLPFRPDFENGILSLPHSAVFESILIEKEIPFWKSGGEVFDLSDFGDYTHLNTCGMKKAVPLLADEIRKRIESTR